jgi:colicin import membrane protein
MSTRSTNNAFLLSATLHGTVVALVLLLSLSTCQQTRIEPRVLELVAGEGNNSSATVAPALGSDTKVKLTLPPAPKVEPTPEVIPAPQPVPPPQNVVKPAPRAPVEPKVPDIGKKLRNQVVRADSAVKMKLARERVAEEKRLAKEEADREKMAKAAAPPKYTKIDAAGIAKGVVGGFTANNVGGAGGKALVSDEGGPLERYFSLLKQRLQEALNRPAGLSDTLVATVEFRIAANGTLSGVRIVKHSGSAEFDQAVLDAFATVGSIGARPDGKSDINTLDFKMHEVDGG